jgi:hypothetical protein
MINIFLPLYSSKQVPGRQDTFMSFDVKARAEQSTHHKKKRHHPIPAISMKRFEVIKDFIWINRQYIVISL